jgi:hypothetical protein
MANKETDQLSESEIAIRMNNAVRRALNTPPTPLKNKVSAGMSKIQKPPKVRASKPKSKT